MPTPTVEHNPAQQRFENRQDGHVAECCYRLDGGVLDLHHTEVPAALQGQGLAALLVQAALGWARENGYRVKPSCSYVAAYMQRKPETQDLLSSQ